MPVGESAHRFHSRRMVLEPERRKQAAMRVSMPPRRESHQPRRCAKTFGCIAAAPSRPDDASGGMPDQWSTAENSTGENPAGLSIDGAGRVARVSSTIIIAMSATYPDVASSKSAHSSKAVPQHRRDRRYEAARRCSSPRQRARNTAHRRHRSSLIPRRRAVSWSISLLTATVISGNAVAGGRRRFSRSGRHASGL